MKIEPEFMLHQIGEEYIVMHDGSTNVDFSRIINLNRTAAYLWQRFRDAEAFIQSLQRCGILS